MVTVMKFSSKGCGPCRMIDAITEDLMCVKSIDIDEHPELVEEYSIASVPTLIFFNDGIEYSRTVGLVSKQIIESEIANGRDTIR